MRLSYFACVRTLLPVGSSRATFGSSKTRRNAARGEAMKVSTRLTNLGIEISLGTTETSQPLTPAKDTNQESPRRGYVYAHIDERGNIFYVGKGEGRRAWSVDRHPLWHRYVKKHLGGKYQVCILRDNLSAEEAEEVEAAWIAQCSDCVVNWQNMGRATDFKVLERYHKLRNANRSLIQQAKAHEERDLAEAANMYIEAIEAITQYASIKYEKGLVGKLLDEEAEEIGRAGEIEALDRLTMCLIKLERSAEAAEHVDRYFTIYRRDLQLSVARHINKRIQKALSRAAKRTAKVDANEQRLAPNRPKAAGR
jgi:hypothetical protein